MHDGSGVGRRLGAQEVRHDDGPRLAPSNLDLHLVPFPNRAVEKGQSNRAATGLIRETRIDALTLGLPIGHHRSARDVADGLAVSEDLVSGTCNAPVRQLERQNAARKRFDVRVIPVHDFLVGHKLFKERFSADVVTF